MGFDIAGPVPAAQYLRMSTEMQECSIENQAAAIAEYARAHNFTIVSTYQDPGRSGLLLSQRPGLQSLLRDIATFPTYRALLVYDVSRFGRFQNLDEAAHYEFLCKQSGVQIVYCAEPFHSHSKPANAILKNLKRYMAAEFSRELGERVLLAQRRLFDAGFKRGGSAPYALCRQAVASDGTARKILASGEWKSVPTDHVRWALGNEEEIRVVQEIFRLTVDQGLKCPEIAKRLNDARVPRPDGGSWNTRKVYKILRNPLYKGDAVWQKTVKRLQGRRARVSRREWITKPSSVPAIVDHITYSRAQIALKEVRRKWDRERILSSLRRFIKTYGSVTYRDLRSSNGLPGDIALDRECGSLAEALKSLGSEPHSRTQRASYIATIAMQHRLIAELLRLFPDRIRLVSCGSVFKSQLLFDGASLKLAFFRPTERKSGGRAWEFRSPRDPRYSFVLCGFWDPTFAFLESMYVSTTLPPVRKAGTLREDAAWFQGAVRLADLCELCDAVQRLSH